MTSYVRPEILAPVFRDAGGEVIDYGSRWDGSPPEDTYSVDTHPERFAPLHTVTDALIEHLRDNYDVEIDDGVETAADLLHPVYNDVVRAVRIRPNDPASATLTLVFSSYPAIYMHAGLLNDFHYRACGCDACDSTWEAEADDLEGQVLAVASGHYRESIEGSIRPWVEHSFVYPDGSEQSGRSRAQDLPAARVKAAKPLLRSAADGWVAWPRATSISR